MLAFDKYQIHENKNKISRFKVFLNFKLIKFLIMNRFLFIVNIFV